MRFPFSTPRPRASRSTAGQAALAQQRATLDGLEVRDSTWDEWVACEQAQVEKRQEALLDSGTGPMRRLQNLSVKQ